jgi:hypothetical protein
MIPGKGYMRSQRVKMHDAEAASVSLILFNGPWSLDAPMTGTQIERSSNGWKSWLCTSTKKVIVYPRGDRSCIETKKKKVKEESGPLNTRAGKLSQFPRWCSSKVRFQGFRWDSGFYSIVYAESLSSLGITHNPPGLFSNLSHSVRVSPESPLSSRSYICMCNLKRAT